MAGELRSVTPSFPLSLPASVLLRSKPAQHGARLSAGVRARRAGSPSLHHRRCGGQGMKQRYTPKTWAQSRAIAPETTKK